MPTNLANLVSREKEFEGLYLGLLKKFTRDPHMLENISKEYSSLRRAIEAVKDQRGITEAAKRAGVSIDALKRWNKGQLPPYFTQGSNRAIDLKKIVNQSQFLFLLGFFQSHTRTMPQDMLRVRIDDEYLWPNLEGCFYDCFGDEAKKGKVKSRPSYKYLSVSSRPLISLIENLTEGNTEAPVSLLRSTNQKQNYCKGFLVNVRVCEEESETFVWLQASVTNSRGKISSQVHDYLDELHLSHGFSSSSGRIRFRKYQQAWSLAKFLPNCRPKNQIFLYYS